MPYSHQSLDIWRFIPVLEAMCGFFFSSFFFFFLPPENNLLLQPNEVELDLQVDVKFDKILYKLGFLGKNMILYDREKGFVYEQMPTSS